MDTTSLNNKGRWHAITIPALHHVSYIVIIDWETLSAVVCWMGVIKCFRAQNGGAEEFNRAKDVAISGGSRLFCCYLWLCSLPLAVSGF